MLSIPATLARRLPWLAIVLLLTACGHEARRYQAQTLSDQQADGDITLSGTGSTYTITQAVDVGNIIFGLDSRVSIPPESRAFLDFPLDGSAGGDALPSRATILSADVQVYVQSVSFAATVPTLLDLVPFSIPLASADFGSSPLTATATRGLDFFSSDVGSIIQIDVTELMIEAQAQGLRDFQLRFLLDTQANAGMVELADAHSSTAPLLTVDYE
jgi:hypothetical protein